MSKSLDNQAVVGSRHVKVKMIVNMVVRGHAEVSDVIEQYGLTEAELHAALAYYYDNQMAFDRDYEEGQALLAQYGVPTKEHLAQIRARREASEE